MSIRRRTGWACEAGRACEDKWEAGLRRQSAVLSSITGRLAGGGSGQILYRGFQVVYDENAPRLVAQGYYPLPTAPVDFKPAKAPVQWIPSFNKFQLLQGWNTRSAPIVAPQPGANIGVRCGSGLVAFDFDCEEAALAISEAFEPSPVNKAGQRAWTPFYRADFDVPSEDFFDSKGRKVLQILSTGRQTVIPPSIHPIRKSRIVGRTASRCTTPG